MNPYRRRQKRSRRKLLREVPAEHLAPAGHNVIFVTRRELDRLIGAVATSPRPLTGADLLNTILTAGAKSKSS